MKLQPLKTYHAPEYPTQESLRQEPGLLRAVPRRWRGNRAVLSALAGALALMNQSCTPPPNNGLGIVDGSPIPPRSAIAEDEAKAVKQPEASPTPRPDWAPIRGKVATPRSAIPEDEAKAAADQAARASTPSTR